MNRRVKNLLSRLQFNEPAEELDGGDTSVVATSGGGSAVDNTAEPTNQVPAGQWPDNWRELYAGGDEKKLSKLGRYASPSAAFDGLFAANNKLSSGEYKPNTPFPDQGTDEEKAAWRELNGIPNDPQGYEFKDIPEEDKEFVDALGEYAINQNIPKQHTMAFVEFLKEQDSKAREYEELADANAKQTAEDALHVEWGNDYRKNVNAIHGFLDSQGLKDVILNGRGPDGTPLGSNPDVMKALAALAFEMNPVSTIMPNLGANPAAALEDEITAIEKVQKENINSYYKDEKMQERYRQLLEARMKMKGK